MFASCAVLAYEAYHGNNRGLFDYSTGAFDCFLFLVGSMYYVAGSYPVLTPEGSTDNRLPKLDKKKASLENMENGGPVRNPVDVRMGGTKSGNKIRREEQKDDSDDHNHLRVDSFDSVPVIKRENSRSSQTSWDTNPNPKTKNPFEVIKAKTGTPPQKITPLGPSSSTPPLDGKPKNPFESKLK